MCNMLQINSLVWEAEGQGNGIGSKWRSWTAHDGWVTGWLSAEKRPNMTRGRGRGRAVGGRGDPGAGGRGGGRGPPSAPGRGTPINLDSPLVGHSLWDLALIKPGLARTCLFYFVYFKPFVSLSNSHQSISLAMLISIAVSSCSFLLPQCS